MFRRSIDLVRLCLLAAAASSMTCGGAGSLLESGGRYEDLAALFQAWRAFQRPVHADGVPDYTEAAMAAQHRGLTNIRRRLDAIDTRDWPVSHQVDWHLVRAEMNGLDFDHRVLRPWANNPAFYVTFFPSQSDQPAREGPLAYGAVESSSSWVSAGASSATLSPLAVSWTSWTRAG